MAGTDARSEQPVLRRCDSNGLQPFSHAGMIPCAVLHLLNSLCQAFRCFFMALSRDDDEDEEAIVNKRRRPQVFKPVSSKTAGDKAVSESTSERVIQAKARIIQRRPRLRRGMGGSSSE